MSALIGFETYVGHHYMPKWTEFSITLMIIAMGFALFGLAVKYLPIFPEENDISGAASPNRTRDRGCRSSIRPCRRLIQLAATWDGSG